MAASSMMAALAISLLWPNAASAQQCLTAGRDVTCTNSGSDVGPITATAGNGDVSSGSNGGNAALSNSGSIGGPVTVTGGRGGVGEFFRRFGDGGVGGNATLTNSGNV